jgi:hypothetical protein
VYFANIDVFDPTQRLGCCTIAVFRHKDLIEKKKKMASKCRVCVKFVYPMDPQINLDGVIFHKPCAKCQDCNCQITISNFTKNVTADETVLLCKTHYFKRFHEGGSYLGGEKFSVKATRDVQALDKAAGGSGRNTPSAVAEEVRPPTVADASAEPSQEIIKPEPVKKVITEVVAAAPVPAPVLVEAVDTATTTTSSIEKTFCEADTSNFPTNNNNDDDVSSVEEVTPVSIEVDVPVVEEPELAVADNLAEVAASEEETPAALEGVEEGMSAVSLVVKEPVAADRLGVAESDETPTNL